MKRKALLGAVVCAAGIVGAGSGAVFADKDGPNGQSERGNGVSICTFSGLNDVPDDPVEGGQVQSFGQIVKIVGLAPLKAAGEFPGAMCNPNNLGHDVPWHVTPRKP